MTNDTVDGLLDWERTALRAWYEATPVHPQPFDIPERRPRVTWPLRGVRLGTAVVILGATVILAAVALGSAVLALRDDGGHAVPAAPSSDEAVPIPTVFGAGSPGSSLTIVLRHTIETVHVTEVLEVRRVSTRTIGDFDITTTEGVDCVRIPPGNERCLNVDEDTGTVRGTVVFVAGTNTTEWDYAGPRLIYGLSQNVPDQIVILPNGLVLPFNGDPDLIEVLDPVTNRPITLSKLRVVKPTSLEHYYVDGKRYNRFLSDESPNDSLRPNEWQLSPVVDSPPDFLEILGYEPDQMHTYLAERYDSVEVAGDSTPGGKYPSYYQAMKANKGGTWERTEVWVDEMIGFPEKMVIEWGMSYDFEKFNTRTLTFSRYNEPLNIPPVPDLAKGDQSP